MNPAFITVVSGLLTAFFIFAGSIKVSAWQKTIFETQLQFFRKYGFNRSIMALVGWVELFGAIALWFPGYMGMAGVLALLGTSAGAICCHLYFDTWKQGIPAMLTFTLSALLLTARYTA